MSFVPNEQLSIISLIYPSSDSTMSLLLVLFTSFSCFPSVCPRCQILHQWLQTTANIRKQRTGIQLSVGWGWVELTDSLRHHTNHNSNPNTNPDPYFDSPHLSSAPLERGGCCGTESTESRAPSYPDFL